MRFVNTILIFVISLTLMASCQKKKECISPLYGVWDAVVSLSEGGLTLTMDIEMSFQNDSTGAFEFSGVPFGGEVTYNRMNFTYVLNGENLDLQMQGSNNSINLKVTELTKESFVLNGFINLFPIDTSELSENDKRQLEVFNNIKFVKSSVSPESRKAKKIKGDPDKIWLVSLGQDANKAKIELKRNNYDYLEKDSGSISGLQQLDHMGYKWDDYSIFISSDNRISDITFEKKNSPLLNDYEIEQLVDQVDEIYGDHRMEHDKDKKYKLWTWKNGVYEVSFMILEYPDIQILHYKKDLSFN